MAFVVKMVVNGGVDEGVDGSEFMKRLHLSEPKHGSLSSSEGQVAVLGPAVEPATHVAAIEIAQIAHRRRVGPRPVGDDGFSPAVAFQRLLQEPHSRGFIPRFRDVALQNLALVIDRAPQIMSLAVDLDEHLVEMPAPLAEPAHAR